MWYNINYLHKRLIDVWHYSLHNKGEKSVRKSLIYCIVIVTILVGCSPISVKTDNKVITDNNKRIQHGDIVIEAGNGLYRIENDNEVKLTDEEVDDQVCFYNDKIYYIVNNFSNWASLQSINIDGSNVHRIVSFSHDIPVYIEFTDISDCYLIFTGSNNVYHDKVFKLNLETEEYQVIFDGKYLDDSIDDAKFYKNLLYISTQFNQDTYVIISNRSDAPEAVVEAYVKRWRIEVFYRSAKQELGLTSCHAMSEQAHYMHVEMLFLTETLVRIAMWELHPRPSNEESDEEVFTHGQVVQKLFIASCRIELHTHSGIESIRVYFDTTDDMFSRFLINKWPKFIQLMPWHLSHLFEATA